MIKIDVEIQERITVSKAYVNEVIKFYEGMPDTFGIGILETSLDKEGVIREIKKLSDVGKAILLMRYKFDKWLREEKKKSKSSLSK